MPEIKNDIEKAKDDIEKKGSDTQTEKDRVDESVAEQIKEDKDEDTQDAKDRVDESEGEEKAEKDKDNEQNESSEKKDGGAEGLKAMIREVMSEVIGTEIAKALSEMTKNDKSDKTPKPVSKENGLSLDAAVRKYTN